MHPLLLHVVMNKVLDQEGNWTFRELKNLRLVCKTWNEVSLPRWRSTAVLRIFLETPKFQVCSGILVSEFLELLHLEGSANNVNDSENDNSLQHLQLLSKPFSRFKLSNWRIMLNHRGSPIQSIWKYLGPMVQYLHLDNCLCLEPFLEVFSFFVFQEESPNLEEIVITNCRRFPPAKEVDSGEVFMNKNDNLRSLEVIGNWMFSWGSFKDSVYFLQQLPNLKKFVMRADDGYNDPLVLWECAEQIARRDRKDVTPAFPNLQYLDYMHSKLFPLTPRFWILKDIGLPLEHLSVNMESYSPNQILKAHWKTLEIFEGFHSPFAPPLNDFPAQIRMPKLRKIYFWGNIAQDFLFLCWMPNLQVLHMNYSCFDKWSELRPFPPGMKVNRPSLESAAMMVKTVAMSADYLQMEHLTELYIDLWFCAGNLRRLGRYLPNLRILHTLLINETFRVVCHQWSELRVLTALFGSDLDDRGITGIFGGQRFPNIVSLKHLTSFSLQAPCDEGKLTDLSVYQGFLHLHFLHTLHICVSPNMTSGAEESLREKICQVRVMRNYGPHEEFECCRRKEFEKELKAAAAATTPEKIDSKK